MNVNAENPPVDPNRIQRVRGRQEAAYDFTLGDVTPVQFPNHWFNAPANRGNKPPISIITNPLVTLAALRSFVRVHLGTPALPLDLAICYVWEVFVAAPGPALVAQWSSFHRIIEEIGAMVTINDMVNCTRVAHNHPSLVAPQAIAAEDDDIWMMLYILCPNRLNGIINNAYAEIIKNNISTKMISNNGLQGMDATAALNALGTKAAVDADYSRLCAIIDMFLSKFLEHKFSQIRLCTITCRLKDCVALTGLDYMCKTINITQVQFSQWLWTKKLGDEYEQLTTTLQEISQTDSYMPYFMPLKLSIKSPYSMTANPNIHMLTHFVCGTMGISRSVNSRIPADYSVPPILIIGKCMVYANLKHSDMEFQYTAGGRPLEEFDDEVVVDQEVNIPRTTEGLVWYNWWKYDAKKMPYEIERWCHAYWGSLPVCREQTIGYYLKRLPPPVDDMA